MGKKDPVISNDSSAPVAAAAEPDLDVESRGGGENNHEDFVNGSESARFEDLRNRLEASEVQCQRANDNLEQMTAQKMALERDVASLQKQNVGLRASNETLVRVWTTTTIFS